MYVGGMGGEFDSSQTNSIAKLKIDNDYLRLRMQIMLKIAQIFTLANVLV